MEITADITKGWMPDLLLENIAAAGGLVTAKNIIPFNLNYYPLPGKASYNTTALSGTPLQGCYVQDSSGVYYNFVGTATKLYRFTKSAMVDVTRASGGAYNALQWKFAPYGNWLVATDYTDVPQVIKDISSGTNFVPLGGSPPTKAKYVLADHEHLILANFEMGGTAYPKGIIWSGRGNIENWPTAVGTPNLITGADYQNFPDMLGVITGMVKIGKKFAIFSEQSISTGWYMGGASTFGFDHNTVTNTGCFYPQSLFGIDTVISGIPVSAAFFWSQESLWMLTESGAKEIGQNVKRTVFSNVNQSFAQRIGTAHWPQYGVVLWAYPTTSSTGNLDKILIYNYREDRMTYADISCSSLFTAVTGGVDADTYNELGDTVSIPGDSAYWIGKNINPILIDTDSKAKDFTGTYETAEIETGELVSTPQMTQVKKAYIPIEGAVNSSSVTVKHRYSSLVGQNISSASSIKSDGSVDLRTSDRRLSLNIQAQGFSRIGNVIKAEVGKTGGR